MTLKRTALLGHHRLMIASVAMLSIFVASVSFTERANAYHSYPCGGEMGTHGDNIQTGPDYWEGTQYHDVYSGLGGHDTIKGSKPEFASTDADDNLCGDGTSSPEYYGEDNISGMAGGDRIYGEEAGDFITAGPGHDTIHAGKGNDNAAGNEGNDSFYGGDGNDKLYGYGGSDSFDCGAGTDIVYAGAGIDTHLSNCETFYSELSDENG